LGCENIISILQIFGPADVADSITVIERFKRDLGA
jgi:hypothetical protein